MNSRIIKQLIFGLIFLFILALLGIGFYLGFLKQGPTCFDNKQNGDESGIDCGGSCMSCQAKYAKQLETAMVDIIPVGSDKTIFYTQISNKNDLVGSNSFEYRFNFYGENKTKIGSTSGNSFIYPNENKFIFAFVDLDYRQIKYADIDILNTEWKNKDTFVKPNLFVKEFKTEIFDSKKVAFKFSRDLFLPIKGDDVKALKIYLQSKNLYSGLINSSFDKSLKVALIKFQKTNNIYPANGYFGSKERDIINKEMQISASGQPETGSLYPITVNGVVKNNDIASVSKIIISAFIYDNLGKVLGISKTEIENMSPTEERNFRLIYPKNIDITNINKSATKVFVDAIK